MSRLDKRMKIGPGQGTTGLEITQNVILQGLATQKETVIPPVIEIIPDVKNTVPKNEDLGIHMKKKVVN